MAGWIEKQLGNVADFASDLAGRIYADSQDEDGHYQSPLELNGLAMRDLTRATRYYQREYPYAVCSDEGYLRASDRYVAESGWRPSTFDLEKTVVNSDFEAISGLFDIQG